MPRIPPVSTTSSKAKSIAVSDRVNVIVEVSPFFRVSGTATIPIVGASVSIVIVSSGAIVLAFPAASVNVPAATLIVPPVVLSSVGVKMAV